MEKKKKKKKVLKKLRHVAYVWPFHVAKPDSLPTVQIHETLSTDAHIPPLGQVLSSANVRMGYGTADVTP